ncbi:MAG: Flp family type IVb pilin [Sphingomonadaceae bacterium]|nr:Flp family type IVb pilin [Sphingomonadaceae bacterium]
MKNFITKLVRDESGAAAAEYALIIAVVAVGIVVALTTLKNGIGNSMNSSDAAITNATK